jgi:hypothetical protein
MLVSALAQGRVRHVALLGCPPQSLGPSRRRAPGSAESPGGASPRDRPTCPSLYAGLVGAQPTLGELRDADTVVPDALADRVTALFARE